MSSASKRLAKRLEARLEELRRPKVSTAHELGVRAQEGAQRRFVESAADFTVYGGGAGGGKSYGLLLGAAHDSDTRGADSVIFRRESVQLIGAGGLLARSQELYYDAGAALVQSPAISWTFPSGATIELRHLQHEKDKFSHQGKEYAFVGFDELTHFSESQFWYLTSRLRTMSGKRGRVFATCNPDPDSWVRKLVDWYIDKDGYADPTRSGAVRYFWRDETDAFVWGSSPEEILALRPDAETEAIRSFVFIAAKLDDNPALMQRDPGYRGRLMALPRVQRLQLLGGNWNERERGGNVFGPAATYDAGALPREGLSIGIGFDLAYTSKRRSDYSVWAIVGRLRRTAHAIDEYGKTKVVDASLYYVLDVYRTQTSAPEFMERVKLLGPRWPTARRRLYFGGTEQGSIDFMTLGGAHLGAMPAAGKGDKFVRAQPLAKAWNEGRVLVPVDAPWAKELVVELESFTGTDADVHDDQVDALAAAFDAVSGDVAPTITTGTGAPTTTTSADMRLPRGRSARSLLR